MSAVSTKTPVIEEEPGGPSRLKRLAGRGVLYALATFFALFGALPFAWMVLTVFKTNTDLYAPQNNPFIYNDPPTLANLDVLWNETNFPTNVGKTLLIAVLVVIITVLIVVPAAYSLVRLSSRWGESLGIMIFLVTWCHRR